MQRRFIGIRPGDLNREGLVESSKTGEKFGDLNEGWPYFDIVFSEFKKLGLPFQIPPRHMGRHRIYRSRIIYPAVSRHFTLRFSQCSTQL